MLFGLENSRAEAALSGLSINVGVGFRFRNAEQKQVSQPAAATQASSQPLKASVSKGPLGSPNFAKGVL